MSQCAAVYQTPSTEPASEPAEPKLKKDELFDPPIDMMVNDYDDERTLEEEEALAAGEAEDPQSELSNLQKEGDMPLEELLALYGYRNQPEEAKPSTEGSKLRQLYEPMPTGEDASRLLRSVSRTHSDDEEEDYDYSPDEEEWKKTIMVGSDYQAGIPEGLCRYDDALPYENEDKLLWDPSPLVEAETEDFLSRAQGPVNGSLPAGSQLRDDEQALFLLLQCGHNVDEALRRRRINSIPSADTMSLWSEEECRNFESGLRAYGKDFHMIHQNKVRTRSVGELVQFYYLWKKTERHDVFANKARLEKKKYTLHPGLTDFMDRFLEEQEGGRDRSSSPNVQAAAEPKKPPAEQQQPAPALPLKSGI